MSLSQSVTRASPGHLHPFCASTPSLRERATEVARRPPVPSKRRAHLQGNSRPQAKLSCLLTCFSQSPWLSRRARGRPALWARGARRWVERSHLEESRLQLWDLVAQGAATFWGVGRSRGRREAGPLQAPPIRPAHTSTTQPSTVATSPGDLVPWCYYRFI